MIPIKKTLIIGISGQDGAYLAKLLVGQGYEVQGTSRDHEVSSFSHLCALGIKDSVKLSSMVTSDFRSGVPETTAREMYAEKAAEDLKIAQRHALLKANWHKIALARLN